MISFADAKVLLFFDICKFFFIITHFGLLLEIETPRKAFLSFLLIASRLNLDTESPYVFIRPCPFPKLYWGPRRLLAKR